MINRFFTTKRAKISAGIVFAALAFAGGTKAYAALHASDCCAPGAPCCHPGADCCKGHKTTT